MNSGRGGALEERSNTLAGINAVPTAIIDAAKGMGMTTMGILWQVEIPMAMTVILTGFRVALIINIGTTALAYQVNKAVDVEHKSESRFAEEWIEEKGL